MSRNSKATQAEEEVLAPRDPTAIEDDWPVFDLHNATITSSDGRPANLLLADELNPLCLTGQLQAASIEDARLWTAAGKPRDIAIEVAQVLTYSYGTFDDEHGSVGLWASGKAGWYLIKPGPKYRRMYDEMVEGVQLLFFIADAYKTPRRAGRWRNAAILPDYTAQELFEKYAIEVIGIEKAAAEAAQKMYKHREFLLASMLARKEGLFWSKVPIYKHLLRKFPADATRIKARLAELPRARTNEPSAPSQQQQHTRRISSDSASTTGSLKRKRGRPPKNASDVISIASSSVLEEEEVPAVAKPVKADPKKVKSKLPTSQPRTSRSNGRRASPEIEDSQSATPAARESDSDALHKDRRKSALRLKPNKPMKGPPKPARNEQDDDDDDDQDELAGPEPAATKSNKRKREDTNIHTTTAKPSNRNSRRNKPTAEPEPRDSVPEETSLDEGIDIPASPSSTSAGASASTPATPAPPETLAHRPAPYAEATWHCALDGCNHRVYGPCSAPETQALIREHYALHAYDDDERVQMVRKMAEPSLPVERLVERVKGLVGLERMEGTRVSGSRFPEAVRMKV